MLQGVKRLAVLMAVSKLLLVTPHPAVAEDDAQRQTKLEDLGRALFFDVGLSRNRTQSCATCHDPAEAFTDWRENGVGGMASLGDDGHTLGDRNAPSLSYAAEAPEFGRNEQGQYRGGHFWDGRAGDLATQAGEPILDPREMNMPDRASVVERLREHEQYPTAFRTVFGEGILDNEEAAWEAMTRSIAAFEETAFFSPFDSRYDRYLRGEYEPTRQEELGMALFFSQQFSNCNQCHMLKSLPESQGETFTNYRYFNIGTPANSVLREANGLGEDHVDLGLLRNPGIDDEQEAGKLKVPTLRNVAVTGPWMHNGVFSELRTVVQFYNKYNSRNRAHQINPETGELWGEPEVEENLAVEELESGSALDERRIDAIVAFLEMLTDRRYEHLLDDRGG